MIKELLKPTIKTNKICGKHIANYIVEKYNTVIFDLNNTLTDYYTFNNISTDIQDLINILKNNNIEIFIVSNTFNKEEIESISKLLDVKYRHKAFKPFPFTIKKLLNQSSKAVLVGDHLFTDILVANISNIDSILVLPMNKKEKLHSKLVRKIEDKITNNI